MSDNKGRSGIENFLCYENKLLDEGNYEAWMALLAAGYTCYMPITCNRLMKNRRGGDGKEDGLSHYDEDIDSIKVRVNRYLFAQKTNMIPSESPQPTFIRYISNIYLAGMDDGGRANVEYNFIVRRLRMEKEVDIFYGKKKDTLIYNDDSQCWLIEKRRVDLASNLIQSNNLSLIF